MPFRLVDPQGQSVPNVVMLRGPNGGFAPRMPTSVSLPIAAPVRAIHLLGGIAGVAPAHVVVIGSGNVGRNAVRVAVGMGARVTVVSNAIDAIRLGAVLN